MSDNEGYQYDNEDDNATMVEFHVDDVSHSSRLIELRGVRHGGRLSVRKPPHTKQIMFWGQDEVVCHEKQLPTMCWYGTDGSQAIRAKDKGAAMHISGVVGREAGYHCQPTLQQLDEINATREGKTYVAEDAAREVLGRVNKAPLTELDISERCFPCS
ncbi:MAG: hypothetical protein SGARI_004655 [Bacillariaceae sp.]